jgi:hypothetical protein
MDLLTLEAGNQAAGSQELASNLLPATIVAAVISQVWISIRERAHRAERQKAALAAIDFEFEEIVAPLGTFWAKVQKGLG